MDNKHEPKRLLLITERFPPDLGGVARSAARTAAGLAILGYEVHVLAWTKTLSAGTLESRAVDTRSVSAAVDSAHLQLHRLGLFSNWDMSLQHTTNVLEWLHASYAFDALWGHYVYPAGFLSVLFAETHGIASVVSARGNDIDRLMFPPGDFARLQWTLQRATVVTSVSRDLSSKIDVLLGTHGRAEVVHNSVDLETFQPRGRGAANARRTSLGIAPEDVVLGFCGELRHKKGLPFLLAALLETNRTRVCRLLIIGAVRPREQAQLTAFFAEHPELEDRIIATGILDNPCDVAECIHTCDVMLAPSVWEGLPNAILESMACGKIVIASDAGGIPEVVDHGVNGFTIPKAQLHRLGEAILEVLDQPETTLDAICQAARRKVESEFDHATESARLDAVLQRLEVSR